ncbi:AAA family ATPase [Nannocystis pusilla]|uniref:AAA family ATPase n=1 Tax=Nannocystis pusilla TaxID=889268 RepID=A0A9X3ERE5_9BACT|nr:AAA family ATPase [Nannocystis pusilla]
MSRPPRVVGSARPRAPRPTPGFHQDPRRQHGAQHLIHLKNMSSGQKMLVIRILSILTEIEQDSLVILEEPELHLDPAWTAQLVGLLIDLFRGYSCHFWIASHSHSVINSVPSSHVVHARDGFVTTPEKPTLLSNEPDIALSLYRAKPGAVADFIESAISAADTFDELERIVSQLGESSTRFRAWRRLLELRGR